MTRAGEEQPVTTVGDARDGANGRPIPHDPPQEGYVPGQPCPICEVEWPCPERRRQRENKKWIDKLLRDSLYTERSMSTIDGVEALRWTCPLGWYLEWTYGEHGLVAIIHAPDGDHRSDDATIEWAQELLP